MADLNVLYDALQVATDSCRSNTVALSGGLDSTIVAYLMRPRLQKAMTIIAKDFAAADRDYCKLAASSLDLDLAIIEPNPVDILLGVSETIRILGNFNDIEIRNSVVMYMLMSKAKEMGINSVVTGDGADELFAGYDYLLRKRASELSDELDRLRKIMHFPSQKIARDLGMNIESPFLHPNVVQAANTLPYAMLVGVHEGRKMGKIALRRLFAGRIPAAIAWRAKYAMQDGAGTAGLINLLDTVVTNERFQEQAQEILDTDGVLLRTKESLFYYQEYRRYHDPPSMIRTDYQKRCPHCRFGLDDDSRFCHMCGLFPVDGFSATA